MTDTLQQDQKEAVDVAHGAIVVADALVVDSQEMAEYAASELQEITRKIKAITDKRKSLTQPLDESKARIIEFFRKPLEDLDVANQRIRTKLIEWNTKQEAHQRELAKKAEAERLENIAKAMKEENEEVREELVEKAISAPVVATAPKKLAGTSSRTTWKIEVVDFEVLVLAAAEALTRGDRSLLAYIQPDEKKILGVAKQLKADTNIPGVRAYADRGLAVRSK